MELPKPVFPLNLESCLKLGIVIGNIHYIVEKSGY